MSNIIQRLWKLNLKGIYMNKTTVVIMAACASLLAGCATAPQPQAPAHRDIEPALVGKPVTERIYESEIEINNQLGLLYKVHSGKPVGSYTVVAHNNDLDARLGSSMTVPQAYAKEGVAMKQDKNWTATPMPSRYASLENNVPVVKPDPLQKKVKRIEWTNNSLNQLVKNLNSAINAEITEPNEKYNLVVKRGTMTDAYISFVAENMTLEQVIAKLSKELGALAEVSLIKENKTLNVIYK